MEYRIKGHTGWYLRYDPEKAKFCGEHDGTKLYRKQTGEYFLLRNEQVAPLEYEEAKAWVKKYLPEKFDGMFGAIRNSGERKKVLLSISASSAVRLKRAAEKTKKSQSELVEGLINKYLQ